LNKDHSPVRDWEKNQYLNNY
jgi:hypothetical protein